MTKSETIAANETLTLVTVKNGDVIMITSGEDAGCIGLQREDNGAFYVDDLACSRFGEEEELVTSEIIGNIYE